MKVAYPKLKPFVRRNKMSERQNVTREEFDLACAAVWGEIEYQNSLPRRTDDDAKSVMDFCGLARRYIRLVEEDWADNPADEGSGQVEAAVHGLRKLAGIFVRSMIYNGIRVRVR